MPNKIYEIVHEKIKKDKCGKVAKQNYTYLLKVKFFAVAVVLECTLTVALLNLINCIDTTNVLSL